MPSERSCKGKTGVPSLGLAHTCRKLRAEFRPLFIARTTFVVKGEDINEFIDSIISPKDTDISTLVARMRIEPYPVGSYDFELDLKPLLQLSQVAEDISIVFKQTAFDITLYLGDTDDDVPVQDRTLQELLEEMLGIYDFAMFIGFAERAIPQIKLSAETGYAEINERAPGICTYVMSVDVSLPDQYRNPLFEYTGVPLSRKMLHKMEKTFIDSGTGLFPLLLGDVASFRTNFTSGSACIEHGVFGTCPYCRLRNETGWQGRMEGLTWSRDMKGGKTSGKLIRYRNDRQKRSHERLRTSRK